jgi:hypothetical protein
MMAKLDVLMASPQGCFSPIGMVERTLLLY